MFKQLREALRREHHGAISREGDVAPIVSAYNTWLHTLAAHIGAGIHVGNKTNRGQRAIGIGGQGGKQVTILIQGDFSKPERGELLFQIACKNHLTGRAGGHSGCFVRLGIEANILQKSFN